jgi:hypothetical protein
VPAPPDTGKDAKADDKDKAKSAPKTVARTFAAGSWVVRMDQPYSRIADALLDRQYWAPDDPQKHPYDDTAWSMGDLYGTEVVRVSDVSVLQAPMQPVHDTVRVAGGTHGTGNTWLVDNNADTALITLRYALRDADISIAEKPFDADARHYNAGSLIVRKVDNAAFSRKLSELGLDAYAVAAAPEVAAHRIGTPRIALMHTWINTQTEGWWRMALDKLGIPYTYISTQTAAREEDLRRKYDVILFGPVGFGSDASGAILNGTPLWGDPIPWKTTALTPNLGIDQTDDIRPGLGGAGLAHLQRFVAAGGVLIAAEDAARFAIDMGLAPGVSVASDKDVRVVGSVLKAVVADADSPVAYGYGKDFASYSSDGMAFKVSNLLRGDHVPTAKDFKRPTGRGGPHDVDMPEGRAGVEAAELPDVKPWEAAPLNAEQTRYSPFGPRRVIPEDQRPRTIVRFAAADELLVAGLLSGGGALAEHAAVVDARLGKGHTLLFAINPIWRGETVGSYALVFNAILNFDHLSAPTAK